MSTLTIRIVRDPKAHEAETRERLLRTARTGVDEGTFLAFSSYAQLFEVFTAKRMQLIERLREIGPVTLRGLARAIDRDVRRVHDDVKVLKDWFVIERDEAGRLFLPYDAINFDINMNLLAA